MGGRGPGHKNLRKIYAFLTEKIIEDAKQDEKHVLDLLEMIIQPPDLVKEELRPKLFKMIKFGRKSQNSRFQLFGFRKSKVFPPEANRTFSPSRF